MAVADTPGRRGGVARGGTAEGTGTAPVEALEVEGGSPVPKAPLIADPAPLGLAGFALTTFMLGLIMTGAFSDGDVPVVLSVAAAYGGLVQLLAGMWAFREGNTFAAVAFSSYGGFWISFVLLEQFFAKEVPMANASHAVGLYLFLWGFFTFYMWIGTFKLNVGLNIVFALLVVAYVLLGYGETYGATTIGHIGGGFTVACAAAAWYVSMAIVLEKTWGRSVLPLIPLNKGITQT